MDRNEVEAYTRWIRARETKKQLERADEFLRAEELTLQDGTLTEAARAHFIRKGGELVLTFLRGQVTIEELDKQEQQGLPDFGAQDILRDELMLNEKGQSHG